MTVINKAGLDLIKEFEGLRLQSYKDPIGIWTIGYGTTTKAGFGHIGRGMTITEKQAEQYLVWTLENFWEQISGAIKREPNENQKAAFLSLAYNIGPGTFRASTCLKRFNAGDDAGAADALTWFNKAGGRVLPGLVRRREAERKLFLTPVADPIEPEEEQQDPWWLTLIEMLLGWRK